MKKFVSSFLIFSTLFSSFAPVHSCFAAGISRLQRPVKRYNVRRCSGPASSLSAKDVDFYKRAALEAFKDKKFIKKLTETADNTMADPRWLKLLKLPFKIVKIGGKFVLKIVDYTIGYWVGDKVCKFLEGCAFLGIPVLIIKKYCISEDTLNKGRKFYEKISNIPGKYNQKLNEYMEYLKKKFSL